MSERMPTDFGFGSDEEMLRDLARKLLNEAMPIEKLRRLVAADPSSTYDEGSGRAGTRDSGSSASSSAGRALRCRKRLAASA